MKTFCPQDISEWRDWLEENHVSEEHVLVILYKKHTGKQILKASDLMKQAICFGWIDTTAKRIDEDRWAINYRKRTKNSKWSVNTLKYGEELFEKKLMSEFGVKMFKEGLEKGAYDKDMPKNPDIPIELKKELSKNKKIKNKFEKLSPSIKRMHYRMILRLKGKEAREKLIQKIIKNLK